MYVDISGIRYTSWMYWYIINRYMRTWKDN